MLWPFSCSEYSNDLHQIKWLGEGTFERYKMFAVSLSVNNPNKSMSNIFGLRGCSVWRLKINWVHASLSENFIEDIFTRIFGKLSIELCNTLTEDARLPIYRTITIENELLVHRSEGSCGETSKTQKRLRPRLQTILNLSWDWDYKTNIQQPLDNLWELTRDKWAISRQRNLNICRKTFWENDWHVWWYFSCSFYSFAANGRELAPHVVYCEIIRHFMSKGTSNL